MSLTIEVIENECVGCGRCVRVCKTGALKMDRETGLVYNTGIECENCWDCIYACPTKALDIMEAE